MDGVALFIDEMWFEEGLGNPHTDISGDAQHTVVGEGVVHVL